MKFLLIWPHEWNNSPIVHYVVSHLNFVMAKLKWNVLISLNDVIYLWQGWGSAAASCVSMVTGSLGFPHGCSARIAGERLNRNVRI